MGKYSLMAVAIAMVVGGVCGHLFGMVGLFVSCPIALLLGMGGATLDNGAR